MDSPAALINVVIKGFESLVHASFSGSWMTWETLVTVLILVYFTILLHYVSVNSPMFMKKYARRHRLTGLLMLCWLVLGFGLIFNGTYEKSDGIWSGYDVILGLLGTATAYTAAIDFKAAHSGSHIKNTASGVLDEDATVTYSEMIEHVYYQLLNLVQVVFLHIVSSGHFAESEECSSSGDDFSTFTEFVMSDNVFGTRKGVLRVLCGLLATVPWLFRGRFPVNKFQDNYNKGQDPWTFNSLMYRSKKYQYIFYKHWMLHGLNASMSLPFLASGFYVSTQSGFPYVSLEGDGSAGDKGEVHLVNTNVFRMYWLCLNVSYVMEFFMQTLVKRKYMSQSMMMVLQRLLMGASTLTALGVVSHVHPVPASLSLMLMFARRKQEVSNFVLVLLGSSVAHFLGTYQPASPAFLLLKYGTGALLLAVATVHLWKWSSSSSEPTKGQGQRRERESDGDDDLREATPEEILRMQREKKTFVIKKC